MASKEANWSKLKLFAKAGYIRVKHDNGKADDKMKFFPENWG